MTPIRYIQLQPGSVVSISDISWPAFEETLEELGEKRVSRIAYSQGMLEIMVPLPEHERAKIVMADLVKLMVRSQQRHWESFGSTPFKQPDLAGVEPDDCFYIQNYQAVIDKDRIDLKIDPPPDLAIESDVTSQTRTDAYRAIGVPELWIYDAGQLTIDVLEGDRHTTTPISPTFPDLSIPDRLSHAVERARKIGTSQALLEFEAWLNQRS